MPTENAVSIKMTPEDITKATESINALNNVLDAYLIAISPEERQELPKMNDKTVPFVEKTVNYIESNPQFAPTYLNSEELKVDLKSVSDLTNLFRPIENLFSKLNDTIMLAGSEAYIASLAYYNSVKQATKMNIPGAKPIYEDLSKRFEKNKKK